MPCVSREPKVLYATSRTSALPSPSRSMKRSTEGIEWTRASFPPGNGMRPMGIFRPSANVVMERARPSGPKSARIFTRSRGVTPGLAGKGYSTVSVIQSRPRSSKAIFIGLWMSGSLATNWISNPGGRWKPERSAIGSRGPADETSSGGLSGEASSCVFHANAISNPAMPLRASRIGPPLGGEGKNGRRACSIP